MLELETRKLQTKAIIDNFNMFKEKLEEVFEDIDKERTMTRELKALKQQEPASAYMVEFM